MASGTQTLFQTKSIYFSPSELGLSSAPTMKELTDAMPKNSIAIVFNSQMNLSDTEMANSSLINTIVIIRTEKYRTFAIGSRAYANISLSQLKLYYAGWDNDMHGTGNGGWLGWKEITMS